MPTNSDALGNNGLVVATVDLRAIADRPRVFDDAADQYVVSMLPRDGRVIITDASSERVIVDHKVHEYGASTTLKSLLNKGKPRVCWFQTDEFEMIGVYNEANVWTTGYTINLLAESFSEWGDICVKQNARALDEHIAKTYKPGDVLVHKTDDGDVTEIIGSVMRYLVHGIEIHKAVPAK